MGSSETELRPTPVDTEGGDHERMAHIVPKDKLTEAMVMGTPVTALCGKVWVPSRDPKKYPVCPTCVEIYRGGGGSLDPNSLS